jgi:hypothetical protein
MKYHSPSMKPFLNQIDSLAEKKLPASLQQMLDHGFSSNGGGVFFSQFFTDAISNTLKLQSYFDLSGFEFTTNKFHIEDYCDGLNPFNVALYFMEIFAEKWRMEFPDQICNACTTFQEDPDIGRVAVFSFYVNRQGEVVIDVNEIHTFNQPICFVQVGKKC